MSLMERLSETSPIDYLAAIITGILIMGGIIFPIGSIFFTGIGASQGQHTGVVTAVERNQNILWDSDITYFKSDAESTQEDRYCIEAHNPALKVILEGKARTREQITIKYKNPFLFWRSMCNGGMSIIYEVD